MSPVFPSRIKIKVSSCPLCRWQTEQWREGDGGVEMTLLLCLHNSLSCIDSVSLSGARVSEKVNLVLTLQVRPVWDSGKDPSIHGSAGLWDFRGSHFKRKEGRALGEFCFVASGLHSWPRRGWLNIIDAFLFCRHRGKTATWCCHHGSAAGEAGRVSSLSRFLLTLVHGDQFRQALIETSS